MKKGYTKISVIIGTMLIMVVAFNTMSNNKVDIKTIKGNIKELDDISVVYTPAIKDLKKEEIVINKDGITSIIKSESTIGRDFIKSSSEHNDIVKDKFVETIYENEDYIGIIDIGGIYGGFDNQSGKYTRVIEKNKKTKEINEYTVPLDLKEGPENYLLTPYYSTKYKDCIYTVSLEYNEGLSDIYIFKTNLKNNESKIIFKKDKLKEMQEGEITFTQGDKIYIQVVDYLDYSKSYFFVYDIEQSSMSKSNEFMNSKFKDGELLNKNIFDYNIIDSKLNILIKDDNNNKSDEGNIKKLIYNIDGDNVTLEQNIKYNLNIYFSYYLSHVGDYHDDKGRLLGIKNVKMVDDKIYYIYQDTPVLNRKTNNNGSRIIIQGNKPVELLVFDTNKNKTVYKGEIIAGDKEIGKKLFLVKDY